MSPSPPALARADSPRPAPDPTHRLARLDRLLDDLGPALRRGAAAQEARAPLATGLAALDAQLGGGLALGRISELCGPPSSGRTSLALALLARATAEGAVVAVVDPGDAFHPASAAAAGVALERVLWARPPALTPALRCCERLLQTGGFTAVWLDTGLGPGPWQALPTAAWQRLARAAAAQDTALLVGSDARVTGTQADLALELRPARARFAGRPALFEGLELEVAVARARRGAGDVPASLLVRAWD